MVPHDDLLAGARNRRAAFGRRSTLEANLKNLKETMRTRNSELSQRFDRLESMLTQIVSVLVNKNQAS